MATDVLGVFAKRPDPGQVKTRLAAATSPAWAAEVARAFLLDTLEKMAVVQVHRVLAYAPADAKDWFEAITQGRCALVPQRDGDIGQRMAGFFETQFEGGAKRIVLLGTDSPTLPVSFIGKAFAELERADGVLGPATDGGYYLIGMARRIPAIFEGIAWSSSQVLRATVDRLRGCQLSMLPPWYDVDSLNDWWVLQGHLSALRWAGIDPGAPHTEKVPPPPV